MKSRNRETTKPTLTHIPVEAVTASERLRRVDPKWVIALQSARDVAGISRDGIAPIEVVTDGEGYRLVAGAHRLEAARAAGEATILAKVWNRAALPPDDQVLLEIGENLVRRDLSTLDRAVYLARWQEIYQARKSKSAKIALPTDDEASANFALSFSAVASETLGISRRSLFYSLRIGRVIIPAVRDALALHPIAANLSELLALADETPEQQQAIAEILLDRDEYACATVAGAIRILENQPSPPAPKRWQTLLERFSAMEDTEQDLFLEVMRERIERWLRESEERMRGTRA